METTAKLPLFTCSAEGIGWLNDVLLFPSIYHLLDCFQTEADKQEKGCMFSYKKKFDRDLQVTPSISRSEHKCLFCKYILVRAWFFFFLYNCKALASRNSEVRWVFCTQLSSCCSKGLTRDKRVTLKHKDKRAGIWVCCSEGELYFFVAEWYECFPHTGRCPVQGSDSSATTVGNDVLIPFGKLHTHEQHVPPELIYQEKHNVNQTTKRAAGSGQDHPVPKHPVVGALGKWMNSLLTFPRVQPKEKWISNFLPNSKLGFCFAGY